MDKTELIAGIAARSKEIMPYRFLSAREAGAEILRLETSLGLSPGRSEWNVSRANARVRELEEMSKKLATTVAAPPAATTASQITLPMLQKLHTLVFGSAATATRLRNLVAAATPEALTRLNSARAANDAISAKFGSTSPAAAKAFDGVHAAHQEIRAAAAGSDSEKFARLATDFSTAGLRVQGLKSVRVNLNRVESMPSGEREVAQAKISTFFSLTSATPDLGELVAINPVAKAAREFLMESGRLDRFGNLTVY